jgi:hypothetical protein
LNPLFLHCITLHQFARNRSFIRATAETPEAFGKGGRGDSEMHDILVSSVNTASDISSAAAVVVEPERALKPQFDDAVLQVFSLNTFVVLKNPFIICFAVNP